MIDALFYCEEVGIYTKSDIIDVFLTFFLLSYGKFAYVTLILMCHQPVERYDEFGNFTTQNKEQLLTIVLHMAAQII